MEKYQQARPQHPYVLPATYNGSPPSYDQVYGGMYGQHMVPLNTCHPAGSYNRPSYPPVPNGMSNHYPAQGLPMVQVETYNNHNVNISNGAYYPDPRRIATSSKVPSSTSRNHSNQASSQIFTNEEEDDGRTVRIIMCS